MTNSVGNVYLLIGSGWPPLADEGRGSWQIHTAGDIFVLSIAQNVLPITIFLHCYIMVTRYIDWIVRQFFLIHDNNATECDFRCVP